MGHSVQLLCERASALAPEMSQDCERWSFLDSFYLSTRYPDAPPGGIPAKAFSSDAAQTAVNLATEVIGFVRGRIEADRQPPTA